MAKLWHALTTSIKWIITLFLLISVITFGVNNSHTITVDLTPTPFVLDIPVFLLFFAALLIGVILGGWTQWGRTSKKKTTK